MKGNILNHQNKYNEALLVLDKAIELNPSFVPAWKFKGDALKALGRVEEANAAYAKAKELGYIG
jgi:Flp pilus assembly protein TadD